MRCTCQYSNILDQILLDSVSDSSTTSLDKSNALTGTAVAAE